MPICNLITISCFRYYKWKNIGNCYSQQLTFATLNVLVPHFYQNVKGVRARAISSVKQTKEWRSNPQEKLKIIGYNKMFLVKILQNSKKVSPNLQILRRKTLSLKPCRGCSVLWRVFTTLEDVHYCKEYDQQFGGYYSCGGEH